MSNPLEPVIARYRLQKAAIAVTIRVTGPGANKAIADRAKVATGATEADFKDLVTWAVQPKHEALYDRPAAEVERSLNEALEAIERLTVLELAAAFERSLRLALVARTGQWVTTGSPDQVAFRLTVEQEIERWSYRETLIDLFPSVDAVDSELRGFAKQVVRFRDWIAHGKHTDPSEARPSVVEAERAFERLSAFLRAAGLVT
jgi:hypothetical protein